MSKTYAINVTAVKDGEVLVDVRAGKLDLISYAARSVRNHMSAAEDGSEFSVYVAEVEPATGDAARVLAQVTGDAEIAGFVLAKRLRNERAAEGQPETGEAESEPTPARRSRRGAAAPAETPAAE